MSEPDNPSRAYLLGRLSKDDRARFEERMFVDDELFFETLTAEIDLADQASRGVLPILDQRPYRQQFLRDGRERVRAEMGRFFAVGVSQVRRKTQWREPRSLTAAAAILVAVIVGGYVLRTIGPPASHEPPASQKQVVPSVLEPPAAPSSPGLSTPTQQKTLQTAQEAAKHGGRSSGTVSFPGVPSAIASDATTSSGLGAAVATPRGINATTDAPNGIAWAAGTRTRTGPVADVTPALSKKATAPSLLATRARALAAAIDSRYDEAVALAHEQKYVEAVRVFETIGLLVPPRFRDLPQQLAAARASIPPSLAPLTPTPRGILPPSTVAGREAAIALLRAQAANADALQAASEYAAAQRADQQEQWREALQHYTRAHLLMPSYDVSADTTRITDHSPELLGVVFCAYAESEYASTIARFTVARALYEKATPFLASGDECRTWAWRHYPDLRR